MDDEQLIMEYRKGLEEARKVGGLIHTAGLRAVAKAARDEALEEADDAAQDHDCHPAGMCDCRAKIGIAIRALKSKWEWK